MFRFLLLFILLFSEIQAVFHLADYENVAIATDLEPDDVLALKIIFAEANRLYCLHQKYPIQLIIVGEGNSAVKKARMEKLLKEHYCVQVKIEVKEGRSTLDNLFPYDGEELSLQSAPFPHKEEGTEALIRFVQGAKDPLIIQLKPVQELAALSLHEELAKKTDVICYGSFNLRKALHDEEVIRSFGFTPHQSTGARLQLLLDQFSRRFHKLGIIETYGVLGEESSVYQDFPWTRPIAARIEQAEEPFYAMFKALSSNWNRYKFDLTRKDLAELMHSLSVQFPQKKELFAKLQRQLLSYSGDFASLMQQMEALRGELLSLNCPHKTLDQLTRDLSFLQKVSPCAGLQFTLSDVILALALIDPSFSATRVKLRVNEKGFLETTPDPASNVYYYDRKEYSHFVNILLQKLCHNRSSYVETNCVPATHLHPAARQMPLPIRSGS